MSFSDLQVIFQGVSLMAIIKIAVDLGKFVKTVEHHEKRLDRIETHFFDK